MSAPSRRSPRRRLPTRMRRKRDQHLGRDLHRYVELSDHRERERPFAAQDLRDASPGADQPLKLLASPPELLVASISSYSACVPSPELNESAAAEDHSRSGRHIMLPRWEQALRVQPPVAAEPRSPRSPAERTGAPPSGATPGSAAHCDATGPACHAERRPSRRARRRTGGLPVRRRAHTGGSSETCLAGPRARNRPPCLKERGGGAE